MFRAIVLYCIFAGQIIPAVEISLQATALKFWLTSTGLQSCDTRCNIYPGLILQWTRNHLATSNGKARQTLRGVQHINRGLKLMNWITFHIIFLYVLLPRCYAFILTLLYYIVEWWKRSWKEFWLYSFVKEGEHFSSLEFRLTILTGCAWAAHQGHKID